MVNELYRQIIHVFAGLFFALLAYLLPKALFLWIVGVLLVIGVVILFFKEELEWVFNLLERDSAAFTGKGALFFGFGLFVTAALFWKNAPMAFAILAIPDAAATITGTLYKSFPLPYNHRKTLLGSVTFFVAASLILSIEYQVVSIFFIAFFLAALESFDYREIPFLDDNLVIPIVTGYLLTFL